MTQRELEEYRQLRATIRERGTARVWIFAGGLGLWASLSLAVSALALPPVATLVPLLALTGVFEAIFALHTGVERVGRYLQVFYEADADATANWESVAMAFGQPASGIAVDPLFAGIFGAATLLNLIPAVMAGGVPTEWAVLGAIHTAFLVRLIVAKRQTRGQRALELAQFERLKASGRERS